MHIRLAELRDAEDIAAIYNAEVTGSTATFDLVPRTVEEQRAWLRERSGALAVLVAVVDTEAGERIAGYASLSKFRDRPAYSTTVESSVYVHQDFRRRGVAHDLMVELLETSKSRGFHAVIARIADSQEASLQLHHRLGFTLVGVEREIGRKFNRWLDVSVMQVII